MSKAQSKIPSPARSQGAITPRRRRTRRTLSSASPAQSEGRLSTVVERFVKSDKFVLSPMGRRSVLPDDTEIEAPRRASWWKKLDGSSRDVLEALDTNKMTDDLMLEEYEFEVKKNDKQSQAVQQSQSSDNESVASIVVPQRRLFNQKKQTQGKFGDITSSRKSLGKTNIEDQSIEDAPKNLFNKGPRNKPVFPAALLNSTNKTINKTVEPETNKQTRPNLFGQAGGKRKNMFTDFVLSDSEEDSEIQHEVFGFKKNNNKRISLGTRTRRMPSLTPSMTTEIDIDDWILLPSSTMIGAQENSRMSDIDMEQVHENQDDTLTENNASLNRTKQTRKSVIQTDENDKTLTNENIEDGNKSQEKMETNESKRVNKTQNSSNTKLNVSGKEKTLLDKSAKLPAIITNSENVEIEAVIAMQQQAYDNGRLAENVQSLEDKIESNKTSTNENIEDGNKGQKKMETNESKKVNKTHNSSNNKLNVNAKEKTSLNKSAKQPAILTNSENVEVEAVIAMQQQAYDNGRLAENVQSLEDKMAELHGECRQKFTSYKTEENICEETTTTDHPNDGESKLEIEQSAKTQEIRNYSKTANNTKENYNLCEKDKTQEEHSAKGTMTRDDSKDIGNRHQDEDIENISENDINEEEIEKNVVVNEINQKDVGECEKDNIEEEVEASKKVQAQDQAEGASKSDQDEDIDKSEKEVEQSVEEQESHHSEEAIKSNQGETMDESDEQEESDMEKEESEKEQVQSDEEQEQTEEEQEQSEEEQEQTEEEQEQTEEEQEQSEAEQEPSLEEQKSQEQFDKINQDQVMDEEGKIDEEMNQENQDEEMEKMIWNDNDDDKTSDASEKEMYSEAIQNNETQPNSKNTETSKSHNKIKQNSDKSKNVTNNSQKIVDESLDDDRMEEDNDVVEETPNNSTQDTTGRNRNEEVSTVKSPEAVLQLNLTNDNESFRPIGRSTTFRKSKSLYETLHVRHSLEPVQESTLGSEGSINSSTEGSEWDSHRTTRKTIRQTFGKEYTTRKSLRALVMQQSAKRQTELYTKNTSKFDKTTNNTINRNDKNISKINKTKNKTVLEDGNNKNASTVNNTRNKTMIEDANSDNASKINMTKNKTVLEDINDQHNSFRKSSKHHTSNLKSPVLETLTHHVPDQLNSELQASYHKPLHNIKEPEISEQTHINPEDSLNTRITENDSEPEISMTASYGQGMTASDHDNFVTSGVDTFDKENTSPIKEISRRATSVHSRSLNNSDQEVLDYEASEQVISGLEVQENSDHDESMQDEKSESEEEIEHSEHEVESEREEDSQQEIEPDSENEETQEDIEEENAQQEIEPDSEHEETQEDIDEDDSQQEIGPDSEHEETQEDIEEEETQESQEIAQEPESEEELSENEDHNISQESVNDQSDREVSREPENDSSDQEDFISALNSKFKTPESRGVPRIVLDSNMMSDDEVDFERVSRPTNNDITENTERESENDITENDESEFSRASEPVHDVSVGSRKAKLLMRLEKIAQKNMEQRQKIRDQVQKSLKPTGNHNFQDIGLKLPRYTIRRPKEPKEIKRIPKSKPKPPGIHTEALPKAFIEDLNYKPPKRFQSATAPWITKRLYTFLETKLGPVYDYRARVRAEELVQSLFSFCRLVRRRDVAPPDAVDTLKKEMARLRVVTTHDEFYDFFREYMPTEIRLKVNPDFVNKIPMPRNVFSEILPSRAVVE